MAIHSTLIEARYLNQDLVNHMRRSSQIHLIAAIVTQTLRRNLCSAPKVAVYSPM